MLRMPPWRLIGLPALVATLAANSGCSDSPVKPIDQNAAIAKASGGDGTAKQSAKAKEASEAAAKTHPKLH